MSTERIEELQDMKRHESPTWENLPKAERGRYLHNARKARQMRKRGYDTGCVIYKGMPIAFENTLAEPEKST